VARNDHGRGCHRRRGSARARRVPFLRCTAGIRSLARPSSPLAVRSSLTFSCAAG
jgi:hypothetical protein